MKPGLVILLAASIWSGSALAQDAEGCVFDKRIDCREGSDSCAAFASSNLEDPNVPLQTPEIRRLWIYKNASTKQREIMLCADEGQDHCIQGLFTERRTKDGAYIGVSILQNAGSIANLPPKLLVSFSAPGGSLQSPFQLVVYKDGHEDRAGWSMLYMGRCDFAKSGDISVAKKETVAKVQPVTTKKKRAVKKPIDE